MLPIPSRLVDINWWYFQFDQKGAVRTKWGTKDELLEAIKAAKKEGIVTYCDAVLNHKDGADKPETFKVKEVDANDRLKYVSDVYDIEGWTGFEFPGRGDKYSSLKWTFNHFTGVDYNNKNQKTAIYKIMGRNKDWADAVDDENSNYGKRIVSFIRDNYADLESRLSYDVRYRPRTSQSERRPLQVG